MIGKYKQIKRPFIASPESAVTYIDSQKLYDGFSVIARIIAKEIARELAVYPRVDRASMRDEGIDSPSDSTGSKGGEKLALSCPEAAKLLGLSRNTIYELVRQNKIPFIRYGKRILIPYAALKKQFNNF
jgi:excisionase family DNA binding protein